VKDEGGRMKKRHDDSLRLHPSSFILSMLTSAQSRNSPA
jgi:hypothetical protein